MKIYFKKNSININLKKANKLTGLMFRTKNTSNLLFNFNKQTRTAIHSFFVFHNFLAIWLDKNNKVLEYKLVKPFRFTIKPKKSFYKLVEIPVNEKNKNILKNFK